MRDARAAGESERQQPPATAGTVERITGMLLDALHASGYVHPGAEASTYERVRRLVHRLNLRARDAEVWLDMLRQIAWKARAGRGSER